MEKYLTSLTFKILEGKVFEPLLKPENNTMEKQSYPLQFFKRYLKIIL